MAAVLLEFGRPEALHLFVGRPLRRLLAELLLVEEPNDIRQRGFRLFQEKEERAPEDVFETDAPGIIEELLERFDDSIGGERSPQGRDAFERIETKGLLRVRNIQVD